MVDFAKHLTPKKVLHLDYETRSPVELKDCGAYKYAEHERCQILTCGASWDDEDEVYLYVNPNYRMDGMLGLDNKRVLQMVEEADIIYAHNAPFEAAITWGKGAAYGFKIPLSKWRCTAAMARKAGLPPSLEMCAEALGLPQKKDPRGKALIKLFSVPQKDGTFIHPRDRPEDWADFGLYCKQDVRVEKEIHKRLRDFELKDGPLATFQFDLRMNERGVPVNLPALRRAQQIIDAVQSEVATRFKWMTGVEVTQREKVREMVGLADMTSETVEDALTSLEAEIRFTEESFDKTGPDLGDLDLLKNLDRKRQLLSMYQKVSYAAVKKVQVLLDWSCSDGRVRGAFTYYGAGTGRWSSRGPQFQNAKKPTASMRDLVDDAYAYLCRGGSKEGLDLIYGDPLEVLASMVRMFVRGPGEILDGDYNAIEGRIACWIAGQDDILEDWRAGRDLYKRATAFVEGISEDAVTKDGRAFGKVVELAAQFGLGTEGFIRTCDAWGIVCDEAKAKRAIHEYYRPTHPKIVERWYLLDRWARSAIESPGGYFGPMRCAVVAGIKYLFLKLPSGRHLAYPDIQINTRLPTEKEKAEMAAGKKFPANRFQEITYWGNLKGVTWGRVKLHGSKIFENEVQAIAGDVMAEGAIEAEARGMAPFALIHDQALAERVANLEGRHFEHALATMPDWAKGLPLRVEAKVAPYYSK